jgi:spore coat polysaccharide biosynthesis predicted glycosyltransferase SpsG
MSKKIIALGGSNSKKSINKALQLLQQINYKM